MILQETFPPFVSTRYHLSPFSTILYHCLLLGTIGYHWITLGSIEKYTEAHLIGTEGFIFPGTDWVSDGVSEWGTRPGLEMLTHLKNLGAKNLVPKYFGYKKKGQKNWSKCFGSKNILCSKMLCQKKILLNLFNFTWHIQLYLTCSKIACPCPNCTWPVLIWHDLSNLSCPVLTWPVLTWNCKLASKHLLLFSLA